MRNINYIGWSCECRKDQLSFIYYSPIQIIKSLDIRYVRSTCKKGENRNRKRKRKRKKRIKAKGHRRP